MMKDLQVASAPLDIQVEREERLEPGGKHEQLCVLVTTVMTVEVAILVGAHAV